MRLRKASKLSNIAVPNRIRTLFSMSHTRPNNQNSSKLCTEKISPLFALPSPQKMGFSLMGLAGFQVSSHNSHGRLVKFHCFNPKKKQSFNLGSYSKYGTSQLGRLVVCKCEGIGFEERTSPNEVKKEIEKCYGLIRSLGRGVVYLGSSRMGPNHSHYEQTLELSKEISLLLDCTSWTGAGPGLMDAAIKGALQAGKPVGGFKIGKEANEWTTTNIHAYLPSETYLTCRFFSARKHGLVDAAVRKSDLERTAIVALPGGIGTLDEMFEILALIQLQRIGSELPVPFLVMNYDSFYSKIFEFLNDCEKLGTVSIGEVSSLWKVFDKNDDALEYLADFYNIPQSIRMHEARSERRHGAVS